MRPSDYLNEFYGTLDNLDKHVKKLPIGVQSLIGTGVGLLVTRMPGDDFINLWMFSSSGGEDYPGKAIRFFVENSYNTLAYNVQHAVGILQNISLNAHNAYQYMLPLMDKMNRVPDLILQLYSRAPDMGLQISYALQNIRF
jgi:hypothetical protein